MRYHQLAYQRTKQLSVMDKFAMAGFKKKSELLSEIYAGQNTYFFDRRSSTPSPLEGIGTVYGSLPNMLAQTDTT